MSSATHNIHVIVTQTGLDAVNTSMKSFSTTSGMAQKSTDALGSSFSKTQSGAVRLSSGMGTLGQQTSKTTSTTVSYGKAVDQAGKSTQGIAAKFQGNKGAIFAFVGMASAGMEAIGMFGMYQSAADKVAQAQETVNKLEQAGAQDTSQYRNAVNDLADAKRGFNFILRNVAMSFGDLVPFTLLAINAIVKMKETVASSKTVLDAATQSNIALGNSAKTAAASGITPLFNSAGQLTGGMTTLGTSARNAATTGITPLFNSAGQLIGSTDELFMSSGRSATGLDKVGVSARDTSKFVGSKGVGLVAGVTALDLVMTKSQSTGTKFTQVFNSIGTQIKGLPAAFTSVGSAVAGFFTNFAGNMGKFGTILKTAGTAAMAFSKTLLLAFMSNPITAAIALISAAVLALITDFGGFRTALNQVGAAIGNAIPPLKGVLTYLGEAGNGALDAAASFLGMETQAQKMAKQAQALAGVLQDDLVQAIQQTVDVGAKLENLDKVVGQFDKLRATIETVTVSTTAWSGTSVSNIKVFGDAFEAAMAMVPVKSEASKAAIFALQQTLEILSKGTFDTATTQKYLTAALDAVSAALGKDVTETQKDIASKEKQGQETKKVQNATLGYSDAVESFVAQLEISNAAGKTATTVIDDQAKALLEWTQKMGVSIDTTNGVSDSIKAWAQEMLPIVPALDEIGTQIKYVEGAGIDWGKTLENIAKETQEVSDLSNYVFDGMLKVVTKLGAEGFPIVEAALKSVKAIHKEVGAEVEQKWQEQLKIFQEQGKYIDIIGEKEKTKAKESMTLQEEYNKKLKEEAEQLAFNAQQLGINVKQVQLSNESLKVAVKFREDEKKSLEDARAGLQELALARGLDISQLELSNEALIEHIKNNKLAKISEDEIQQALIELQAAREEDIRAAALQGEVAKEWIATMNETIPVTQMSGEGLMQLAEIYTDVKNATSIAADEIGLWYAELEKGEAIEEASIAKMLELAEGIGVEIPASIQDSVPDMQNYVQQILRIGDAAKKMKDDALAAFDELRNKAKSGLEKIFSEALGEDGDNIKKALKGIDKVGQGIDSINAKQIVIDAFLNDTNYNNKVESLSEIMEKEYGDIATLSQTQGFDVGDTFAESLRDAVGKKGKPVADQVDTIWAQVKASAQPGETGNDIIGRFGQALEKAGIVEAAIKSGATDPILAELGLIPPQVAKTGKDVTSGLAGGLKSGANTVANEAEKSLKDPVVQNAELIPGETGKAVAPVEGVFSDVFLKASVAATGQISMLLADITLSMGFLKTNIETALTGIEGLWITHATNVGTYIENIKLQLLILQQTFSSLSSNILTYTTSMGTNISTFSLNAVTELTKLNDYVFNSLQQTFSNLSLNVATYMKSMISTISQMILSTSEQFMAYNEAIFAVQSVFSNLSSNVLTYMTSITGNIAKMILDTSKGFQNYVTIITSVQQTFSNLSSNIKTYTTSMNGNINGFVSASETGFGKVASSAKAAQSQLSNMSTSVSTYMSSMTTKVNSFSSACQTSFGKVGSAAEAAMKKVQALQKSIDALKDKTITITVNLEGAGTKHLQHGGSALNLNGPTYAAAGAAWVQNTPRKIGGTHVAETFPEIITAIPLDPKEKNSPFHDLNIPMSSIQQSIPQIRSRGGSGSSGGGQPINVHGEIHITNTLGDGRVISEIVKPFMLKNYSGITSS